MIKNIDRGLKTLGGDKEIGKWVKEWNNDGSLGLFLRPDDPICKPLEGKAVESNDVLLKITVPRRTGRKRKRGSLGPYEGTTTANNVGTSTVPSLARQDDPRYLLRSMRDNVTRYKVEAVGMVRKTYRFRDMADFQFSTPENSFFKKMDGFASLNYEKLKKFKFDPSRGPKPNAEMIPPPLASGHPLPFNYGYLQNPAVKIMLDASGTHQVTNTQIARKQMTHMVRHDSPIIPTGPPTNLRPLETLEPRMQRTIKELRDQLEVRPIWSRRALVNHITVPEWTVKFAWQYCGYLFKSGPWRDGLVKFGVDPRTDPKYRIYQTLMFQMGLQTEEEGGPEEDDLVANRRWRQDEDRRRNEQRLKNQKKDRQSHLFDGRTISLEGKVWQVCDISDPLLKGLLATEDLRETCEMKQDGWYQNGLWAKVRVIMKEKAKWILAAEAAGLEGGHTRSDTEFDKILAIPDHLDENNWSQAILRGEASSWEVDMAADIRMRAAMSVGTSRLTGIDNGEDAGVAGESVRIVEPAKRQSMTKPRLHRAQKVGVKGRRGRRGMLDFSDKAVEKVGRRRTRRRCQVEEDDDDGGGDNEQGNELGSKSRKRRRVQAMTSETATNGDQGEDDEDDEEEDEENENEGAMMMSRRIRRNVSSISNSASKSRGGASGKNADKEAEVTEEESEGNDEEGDDDSIEDEEEDDDDGTRGGTMMEWDEDGILDDEDDHEEDGDEDEEEEDEGI
ncbi:MAG: tau 95 subunit of transcription factor TFIIIC [Watsoniomyces obsoletus]|nr:MAG: tau 95 subunit of transcription factor TFIIIC [Watsoniomyces obsoletus]